MSDEAGDNTSTIKSFVTLPEDKWEKYRDRVLDFILNNHDFATVGPSQWSKADQLNVLLTSYDFYRAFRLYVTAHAPLTLKPSTFLYKTPLLCRTFSMLRIPDHALTSAEDRDTYRDWCLRQKSALRGSLILFSHPRNASAADVSDAVSHILGSESPSFQLDMGHRPVSRSSAFEPTREAVRSWVTMASCGKTPPSFLNISCWNDGGATIAPRSTEMTHEYGQHTEENSENPSRDANGTAKAVHYPMTVATVLWFEDSALTKIKWTDPIIECIVDTAATLCTLGDNNHLAFSFPYVKTACRRKKDHQALSNLHVQVGRRIDAMTEWELQQTMGGSQTSAERLRTALKQTILFIRPDRRVSVNARLSQSPGKPFIMEPEDGWGGCGLLEEVVDM